MDGNGTIKERVFFFEDHSAKDLNETKVGRKGLSLFKLKDMDVPVPEFFVVSSSVFVDHSLTSLDKSQKKLLAKGRNPENDEIENVILKESFSKEIEEEILSAYTRLSGFTDAWVSVRSSVVFSENSEVSFSGIFATELNVRKYEDVSKAIKRIYASLFTDDVVAYASKMGIDLADVKMAVVVQKMVQSEVSGVAFTIDPITQDKDRLSIEAVFGLGDVISLGEITPDSYLLNKKDLSVVEKHIAPQEWMKVRTMKPAGKGRTNIEKIKISNNWSHRQKLANKDMEEVAKIALIVENKSRQPQNLEWVLSGGRFWVLQNKPLFESLARDKVSVLTSDITRKSLRELIAGFVEKYKGENMVVNQAISDAQRLVQQKGTESNKTLDRLIMSAQKESEEKKSNVQDDFILSGVGASFGSVVGKITVVDGPVDRKFDKQDILLIKRYSSEMESMIMSSAGIIMDAGGVTSDTAILCREFGIPAVVGTKNASEVLKSGDWVKIDGNTGTVYRSEKVEEENVHPVVDAYSKGEVSNVNLLEEDKPEEKEKIFPVIDRTLPPCATKVFSMTNLEPKKLFDTVGNSRGIVYVDLDKIIIEEGRHPLAYVEDKKFVDYSKLISEKILEYVELAQGDEVVVSIGSRKSLDFKELTKGKTYENDSVDDKAYGATHYINNPELLKRVLSIVRRVRNVYKKRNVSLGIHSPMSGDLMKEFKKILSGEKLRRTASFNIYAILDNPAEIILADEIVSTQIDGLILNMPRIARQMQGFNFDDSKAKYDLSRNSVFTVLDNVIDDVRSKADKIIVVVENNKPLLRYCVQAGVYGVAVWGEDISEARKVVSEEESKIILSK